VIKDLVARFPERNEYIVNTSEFTHVKERLARLQGAARKLGADGKPGEQGPPTLKRRPSADPDEHPAEQSEPGEAPELKRRNP
jgi:hypothetical protein